MVKRAHHLLYSNPCYHPINYGNQLIQNDLDIMDIICMLSAPHMNFIVQGKVDFSFR
jgi:hypothetical protein